MKKDFTFQYDCFLLNFSAHFILFFCQGFLSQESGEVGGGGGGGITLLFSTTSARSGTFGHLFVSLHVRWLLHIFNHSACDYQTAAR